MEQNINENTAQTVGDLLRNERLKRGMTLSDLSADLCIRKSYLNAIENMDFANIPPLPFGLGFVRSYADYMELNSNEIVAAYKQALLPSEEKDNSTEDAEISNPHVKHLLLAVLGFTALFCIWYYLLPELQNNSAPVESFAENNISEPLIVADEVDEAKEEVISETDAPITDNIAVPEENEEESEADVAVTTEQKAVPEMKLIFNDASWLELKRGNEVIVSGIYKKDFVYKIPAEKGLTISIGRPKHVKFYLDDKPINVVKNNKKSNIKLDEFFNIEETD